MFSHTVRFGEFMCRVEFVAKGAAYVPNAVYNWIGRAPTPHCRKLDVNTPLADLAVSEATRGAFVLVPPTE